MFNEQLSKSCGSTIPYVLGVLCWVLCIWLADEEREKEENHSGGFLLVTPGSGTHHFPSHGPQLSYMAAQTARDAEENVLAVCPGGKGTMSTDVYRFGFADELV